MNRRQFLSAAAFTAAAALGGAHAAVAKSLHVSESTAATSRKLIIVLFGGGTRSSESIDDPQHRHIPHLWNDLVPKGTLFTNMRVEHKVVHPNSAGSVMTGHWEWDDIDWSRPVAHPTVFELYRKVRRAPDTATWAFVYASILANTGESLAPGYGRPYAANVVEPPTIPRTTAENMDQIMQHAAALGSLDGQVNATSECEKLARQTSRISTKHLRSKQARDFLDTEYANWKAGAGTTSHDAFLTDRAISCMRTFAPDVLAVDYGEIDCAHYGSWSRYVDAIRRTDQLTPRPRARQTRPLGIHSPQQLLHQRRRRRRLPTRLDACSRPRRKTRTPNRKTRPHHHRCRHRTRVPRSRPLKRSTTVNIGPRPQRQNNEVLKTPSSRIETADTATQPLPRSRSHDSIIPITSSSETSYQFK
ncbi:MAG: hypothetical protein ACYSR6_11840 [Planctomycetota bacterium]